MTAGKQAEKRYHQKVKLGSDGHVPGLPDSPPKVKDGLSNSPSLAQGVSDHELSNYI